VKYYHRLDFQLAAIFIIVFSFIITVTGLLNQVSVQIWAYDENTALEKQLTLTRELFSEFSLISNETELIKQAKLLFNS